MILTALLVGFSLILVGFIIDGSPRKIAGFDKMADEELQSKNVKKYVWLRKLSFIICGVMILLSGIIAETTGIAGIFKYSLPVFLSLPMISAIYSGYRLSGNRISFLKMSALNIGGTLNMYTLLFVILFPVLLISYFSMDASVKISGDHIKIGGLYGDKIMFDEIKTIDLVKSLPDIQLRTNGFALGKTLIGYFKTKNSETVKLFVHSKSPYIKIQTNTRLYFISFKKADKTVHYYQEIVAQREKL